MTTPKRMHIHVDLENLIRNWKDGDYDGCFNDGEGNWLSADEAKERVKFNLANGIKVMPCCAPAECPDFDYNGGACPGHAIDDDSAISAGE